MLCLTIVIPPSSFTLSVHDSITAGLPQHKGPTFRMNGAAQYKESVNKINCGNIGRMATLIWT
jgi:hypothetical protein